MRSGLPLVLLLACACRCDEPASVVWREGLVAAVVDDDHVRVVRSLDGATWSEERALPRDARALRFSPDGSHVAWVVDETHGDETVPVGWVWRAHDEAPESLGELGLRTLHEFGLALAQDGRVAWLAKDGTLKLSGGPDLGAGWGAHFDLRGDLAFVSKASSCVELRGLAFPEEVCGDALDVLDLRDDLLLARTNVGVVRLGPDGANELATRDVVGGSIGKGGTTAIVRRFERDGVIMEEVATVRGRETIGRLENFIVVSLAWDDDGTLLVVERSRRQNLLELMLAHTPADFGGEASSGTAVRLDLASGDKTGIPGLEGKAVRTLFRARTPSAAPRPD